MTSLGSLADQVRRGELLPLPWAALLSAATPLWRLGMWARHRQRRVRVNAHVISFGNITVGGTGKTPAVIARARAELQAGNRVAVLTRGYGAARNKTPTVVRGETSPKDLYRLIGDEPALIVRKAPGVVLVRCADRVAAARNAIDECGCNTLILDDGFQYVRLERDEDIVLVDATNPFGNGWLVPRGILREPLTALSRATEIVLTRCDQVGDAALLQAELERRCPGIPIRTTCHAPTVLWRVSDGGEFALDYLRGREVTALCAIANPEAFFATVESSGATVVQRRAYPDHADLPRHAIPSSGVVVTTEKDAMRLEGVGENVLALGVEMVNV